jgi:MFS family permease
MSRDLILVALSMMTWGVGEGMFLFFQPIYLQQLGANPILIGGILGGIGIGMTISYLPAGYLSDRFGRRPILWSAWVIGTSSTWIMALSNTLPTFVLGSALYGMTSFVLVPLNSYLTHGRGNWSVGRTLTLISATYSAGVVLGPMLGGWIGDNFGLQRTFFIAACIFIISTIIILFIRPQPVEKHSPSELHSQSTGFLSKRYLQYLVIIFIVMFALYLPQPLSQNFLQNERGLSLTQIGQLISTRALGIVFLNLALGQLNARHGFLLAQVCMALFTVFLWQGNNMLWYSIGYFFLGGYQTARALASAQSRSLFPAANMGIGYGLIETASASAIILAPPIAGVLYANNPLWIYSVGLALIGIALLVSMLFSPIKSKDLLH